jgi:putative endonuclease
MDGSYPPAGGRRFESGPRYKAIRQKKDNLEISCLFCLTIKSKSMYVVYVLHSQKFDKIYIGYTSDLIDRFMSHNKLSTKGFTANFRPWKVIYVEFIDNKSMALVREKQLKSARGRIFCREQIVL